MGHGSESDPMRTRDLNAKPWRFRTGQHAYVRGWAQDQNVVITSLVRNRAFPHYLVVDGMGREWQMAQVQLSTKPIPTYED